jgi:diguanylate cyclase (GGDEF)-like protein
MDRGRRIDAGRDMTSDADHEQDAGLGAFARWAIAGSVLGGVVGLVLGPSLGGQLAGAIAGAAFGFAVVSTISLVGNRRRTEQLTDRIDELETTDALTGLGNAAALRAWLEQHLPQANTTQSQTAVLVIHAEDLDRINESHGRAMGDALLQALVARVRSCLLPEDELFRAGGTEVAVVRPDLSSTHVAEELAERLLELLATPYDVEGELLRIPVSVGLAVSGGRPTTADDLLRDAEVATYRAAAAGPGSLVRFEQALAEFLTPATAEHRLRTALERGDFQVAYLPVFSLTTGEVVEVEALLRWIDERRGLVAADEFLAAMEQTGIIVPIGEWVIQEICRQATYWARTFPSHRPLRVTANISRRQLLQADFPDLIARSLKEAETDPRRVILEINERSLTDRREDLWPVLRRCKDLGVGVSLDDLGASNSSLATLRHFQLDQVKIDRSFVDAVLASREDAAVVRHITALCRELGIVTVAKAVQARDQAERLCQLGVEHALGRFFTEPITPGQVDALIYADLTRYRAANQQPPPPPPTAVLPQRAPGEHSPGPVPRTQPVVVPALPAERAFPRRASLFS